MQMFWLVLCLLVTLPMYSILSNLFVCLVGLVWAGFCFFGWFGCFVCFGVFFLGGGEEEVVYNHSKLLFNFKMSLLLILKSHPHLRPQLLWYSLCLHLSNADTKHMTTNQEMQR